MKNSLIAAAGVLGAASLVLTGCSNSSDSADAQYQVSGEVVQKWTEYECADARSLSIDPVSYSGRTGGGSGGSKKSKSGSGSTKKEHSGGSSTGSGSTTSRPSSGTDKKPSSPAKSSAPVKVSGGSVPHGKPEKPKNYSSKWCETEYELFVEDKNGDVFEQDVPYEHYAMCDEKENFSSCI